GAHVVYGYPIPLPPTVTKMLAEQDYKYLKKLTINAELTLYDAAETDASFSLDDAVVWTRDCISWLTKRQYDERPYWITLSLRNLLGDTWDNMMLPDGAHFEFPEQYLTNKSGVRLLKI